ncbi:hypothetical protein ACUV84_029175 [Puccinellia chinampoensis]
MGRSEIEGFPFIFRTPPEFEGEADARGCITKLPPNTVQRRHQQKRKSPDRSKLDEVKEMVVGAGSKEDGMVQPAGKGKKLVKLGLSKELLEYIRTREVMGIIATETPRPSLVRIPDVFDGELKEQIAAEYKENREFDAYVLHQYRTKGYAEILYEEV